MSSMLCVLYIIGLLVSIMYEIIKYFNYFNVILRKPQAFTRNSKRHRCSLVRLAPMYREEYFGYKWFVLIDSDNVILMPHPHMRVFGVVHQASEVLMLYKGDLVESIIVMDDIRYANNILDDWRKVYRNIIICITGGILLWHVCSLYMTL